MKDPYQSPDSFLAPSEEVEPVQRRRKFWRRMIWISGAGVIASLMFGLIGTVVGMVGAFEELSKTGEANPEELAGDIAVSLMTTLWGLVISMISVLVLVFAIICFRKLSKLMRATLKNSEE